MYDPATQEALAFVFLHGQIPSHNVGFFQVTVREVENKTCLNFLSKLPAQIEQKIETTKPPMWDTTGMADWRKARRAKCAKGSPTIAVRLCCKPPNYW
jgi:hypothetical protein